MANSVPIQPQRRSPPGSGIGQQSDDKPHEGREDQTDEKGPAETDPAAAADDAHQHGEQASAQDARIPR